MRYPSTYDKDRAIDPFIVDYRRISSEFVDARINRDRKKNALVLTACQNDFSPRKCDVIDICDFIYRNIEEIDDIFVPLIAHPYMSIFSPLFWLDRSGKSVKMGSTVTLTGFRRGDFHVNPDITRHFSGNKEIFLNAVGLYLDDVEEQGKKLKIRDFCTVIGTLGFAMVSSIEEAVFSHSAIYRKQPNISVAGPNPFSDFNSVFIPEIPKFLSRHSIVDNSGEIDRIAPYETIVFASLSKEVGFNSLADFIDKAKDRGLVYSNHNSLNGGRIEKESNILNKKDVVFCDLSKISL